MRRRREAIGASQEALADAAGLGVSTVIDFERQRRTVGEKSVRRLAAALTVLERRADDPVVETVELPVEDLRAVLDEIRAVRRLHEETAARVEALAARIEGSS